MACVAGRATSYAGHMTSRLAAVNRAHVADALTASRFVLAVILVPIVARGAWLPAGIVVAAAWWTDFLDGRVARSTTGSRLGDWDPHADTVVGFGIVVGLAGGGHLPGPVWWLVIGGLLTVTHLLTGIFAFSELAQALGYGPLLYLAAVHRGTAFLVMVATIGAILVLDATRFRTYTLPAFFDGLRSFARLVDPRKRC